MPSLLVLKVPVLSGESHRGTLRSHKELRSWAALETARWGGGQCLSETLSGGLESLVSGRSWKVIWHLSPAAHTRWVMGLGSHGWMNLAKCGQRRGSSGWTGLPGKHRPALVYMYSRLSAPSIHKPQILLGSFVWHPRWSAAQTWLQFGGYPISQINALCQQS